MNPRLALFLIPLLPTLAAARPPNIIFILTDDQGYNDLGCYGSPTIKTPRIDRMAAEGMKFTDFYDAAPVCTPTRAAFLTGCYPQRVGMGEIPPAPGIREKPDRVLYQHHPYGLNPSEITIAKLLKSRGYATACFGKWHLGDAKPFLPTSHGFDSYFGILYSNDMKPVRFVRDEQVLEGEIDQTSFIDRYTEESIKFITANREKPFFLYLAHNMPHVPISVAERFRGKSAGGLYGDVIEALDWSTGQILDTLQQLKLDNDTLVVFTSDNGPWLQFGEHGGMATPLRSGKGSTYEGGMRVPCIARWPGKIPAGAVCHEMVCNFDFYPTFANFAGAAIPTDRIIDGKDISDLLFAKQGAKTPHEVFYYYVGNRLAAVRSGQWKLKLDTTLIEDYGGYGPVENPETRIKQALYNLAVDPGEQKSALKDHPDIAKKLREFAAQAREDLGDDRTGAKGKNVRPIGTVPSGN